MGAWMRLRRRRCDECGKDYLAQTGWSKFCSNACRERVYRRRRSEEVAAIRRENEELRERIAELARAGS